MNFWRYLFREFSIPEAFEEDVLGELGNQCGHTLGAMVSVLVFCTFWNLLFGEMPYRSVAFVSVFLPYVIYVEWYRQGWLPKDSWFDSLIFLIGTLSALAPFREVKTQDFGTVVVFEQEVAFTLLVVWLAVMIPRLVKRYKEQVGDDRA